MAEFIMKDKVNKLGLSDNYLIESRATSYEEDGNDMYPPAKRMLEDENVPYSKHRSTRLEISDLDKFDYFICMEDNNIINTKRIIGDSPKIIKLLDRDIADPWYTGEFLSTYNDLTEGIDKLLENNYN
jgi:protein-tyrosine phosphatase